MKNCIRILLLSLTFLIVMNPFSIQDASSQFFSKVTERKILDRPVFQKGMSYVAWSNNAFSTLDSDRSLDLLKKTNVEWIAICVFWYQSNVSSHDIHPEPELTADYDSIIHVINKSRDLDLKVMLKPMIDLLQPIEPHVRTSWRGEIQPSDEWFERYTKFILGFASLAEQYDVDLFCIGCELKRTTQSEEHWEKIVSKVRERYSGPIIYAADGSNYDKIEWWFLLDYIGINAYFPLNLLEYDPSFEKLKSAWINCADEIENWQSTIGKPIILTEIGYRSCNGTNLAPGNYWMDMSLDLQEQADCYEASLQALWNRSWFYGFYWWNWETNPEAGGNTDVGYTPQNKPAQNIIKEWYSSTRWIILIDRSFVSVERCGLNEKQRIGFHASWEHNNVPVIGACIVVNETKYFTNETGYISFEGMYEIIGKQMWTITNVHHTNGTTYKNHVADPFIIWDEVEISLISVEIKTPGWMKVMFHSAFAYDRTPISGATFMLKQVPCAEIEPGIFVSEVFTLEVYPNLEISVELPNFELTNTMISIAHFMNLILYLGIFLMGSFILLFALRSESFKSHLKASISC